MFCLTNPTEGRGYFLSTTLTSVVEVVPLGILEVALALSEHSAKSSLTRRSAGQRGFTAL